MKKALRNRRFVITGTGHVWWEFPLQSSQIIKSRKDWFHLRETSYLSEAIFSYKQILSQFQKFVIRAIVKDTYKYHQVLQYLTEIFLINIYAVSNFFLFKKAVDDT